VNPSLKLAISSLMRLFGRNALRLVVLLALLFTSRNSPAYSVLTHEQVVDLLWKAQIRSMLLTRFPDITPEQLHEAHAYAYGGCLIQDIGYYPFGNHFFSDLVHYVRSGDFVTNMLTESLESKDINEYAFALGALAHYASDIAGHPAVNVAVADQFPKLRAKYGNSVTYADNHSAHIRTEFGFDVIQVARGRFTSQGYHDFIGFEVSEPLLRRAFLRTYGISLDDIFPNLDLAIGTFRYSVSRLIPQMTRVAIVMKKDEVMREDPTMTRKRFLYHLKTSQYRHDFGKQYQRPNLGDRILAFFLGILPKVGPLKTLDFKVPNTATEELYMQSVNASRDQYAHDLTDAASNTLHLDNRDFDTGQETKAGEYSLTDETYADLLGKLADHNFGQITPELKVNVLDFYRDPKPPAFAAKNPRRWTQTLANLTRLQATEPEPLAQSVESR
jgi:Zinc dependent phospholipase C